MEFSRFRRIFSPPKNLPFLKHSLGAVAVRALCSVAMSKWVAVWFGPAGTALFGQFINLFGAFTVVANDGLARAMVKEGAHFQKDGNFPGVRSTATTALMLMLGIFALQWMLMLVAARLGWMNPFFGSPIGWFLFPGFAALAATYFSSAFFLIPGKTNLQAFLLTSISVGALVGLVLSSCLGWGLFPALAGLTMGQILVGGASFLFFYKELKINVFSGRWDKALAIKMLGFTLAVASTAFLAKVADYAVVRWAIGYHGTEPVGVWVAMNRLADAVNIPILAVTNGILLPLLSAHATDAVALRQVLRPVFLQTLVLTFLGFALVFMVYPLVLQVLFSADFVAQPAWVSWQIAGDFFKSNAFLISILLLAVGATRFFFWLEISSIAILLVATIWLSHHIGMEGVFVAHALRYAIYWGVLLARFRRILL